jgi:CheY-like chemotaxis protein
MNVPTDTETLDHLAPETLAKASSELNNLLQIISGTSTLLEDGSDGSESSEKYLSMLRTSIERAEKVAENLVHHAGGTNAQKLMHPDLAGFVRSKTGNPSGPNKRSIMLVDDEEMALTLVKRVLENAGFAVATASSGFQCLEFFRKQPLAYEMILLDLTMPFMDGEETFKRLREIRADIPVVLCTGFIQQERLGRLMSSGLTGFLRKPIAADEIVSFVRSTLASVKYSHGSFDPNSVPLAI